MVWKPSAFLLPVLPYEHFQWQKAAEMAHRTAEPQTLKPQIQQATSYKSTGGQLYSYLSSDDDCQCHISNNIQRMCLNFWNRNCAFASEEPGKT